MVADTLFDAAAFFLRVLKIEKNNIANQQNIAKEETNSYEIK